MGTEDDGSGLYGCRPILYAQNVARSIAYYVDVLGFRLGWAWSDAEKRFLKPGDSATPMFALVGRGRVHLMLSQQSQGAPGMWLHVDVDTPEQLDALHETWGRNGRASSSRRRKGFGACTRCAFRIATATRCACRRI